MQKFSIAKLNRFCFLRSFRDLEVVTELLNKLQENGQ